MKALEAIGMAVVGALVVTVGVCIGMLGLPLVVFFGWLAGKFLCFFAGSFIVSAIATLLGVFGIETVVTVQMIPFITAALAFFGYFFKAKQTNNNKSN